MHPKLQFLYAGDLLNPVKPRQKREGIVPVSEFGRLCRKLGIDLIGANSPQAKGRVERGHGTHQDRLIKKMRLTNISGYASANAFLADRYLAQHNARYAVKAHAEADYHLRVPPRMDLEQVFCLEEERIVSADWVVQYGTRWLQIEREQKARVERGATVVVREHRDRALTLWLNQTRLRFHEVAERPRKAEPLPKRHMAPRRPSPSPEHPWRQRFTDMRPRSPNEAVA